MQLPFFAKDEAVLDKKCQDYMALYNFCDATGSPVSNSAIDTPTDIFDAMVIIAEEINKIKIFEQEKRKRKE